jgi:hypothetical protein
MNKEELKNYIHSLELPVELEGLLYELVEGAPEVNQVLLDAVADVIDMQADFLQKEADVLNQEADQYEDLANELNLLDEEEYTQRATLMQQSQEQLLNELTQKVQEVEVRVTDANQVNTIQQELNTIDPTPQVQ